MGADSKGVMGGVTSMVASRFTPWHYSYNQDRVKLTDLDITSGRQGLVLAGCDWGVNKVSLAEFMPDHDGAQDHHLLMRSDNGAVLGVHGERYTGIDNFVLGDLADAVLLAAPGSRIPSTGSLYDPGKVVWILIELPASGAKLGGREVHEKYVLLATSHDGSMALTARSTRVRVECMNTMSMAMAGSRADYVIRHTTNALSYVEEARRSIGVATANSEAWDHAIEELIDTPMDEHDVYQEALPTLLGDRPAEEGRSKTMWDQRFDAIVDCYEADHNDAIMDTAWGFVNAVNEYEEWGVKPRGQETHERQMAMMLSGSYDLTKKALALVS